MKQDLLLELENFYASLCNGVWEHSYGIKIFNLDNPGWGFEIDLTETNLEHISFDEIDIQRNDENNWMQIEKINGKFLAYCGPNNLAETISIFLEWVKINT